MFGNSKPPNEPPQAGIPAKLFTIQDAPTIPVTSLITTVTSTITSGTPTFATCATIPTPVFASKLESGTSVFKQAREASNPFGKVSKPFAPSPNANLFSKTTSKQQPMPSATSLFEPSTSSSFFLSASKSVKPVFSAKTLAKSTPNIDKGHFEKVDMKPALFSTSPNPFTFKANAKSNSTAIFGETTSTFYKSSVSSPFSFVKKTEAIASSGGTEKSDSTSNVDKTEVGLTEAKEEISSEEKKTSELTEKLVSTQKDTARIGVKLRIGTNPASETDQRAVTQSSPDKTKFDSVKYKSILLKGVPKEFNNKIFMKKHFSKYGRVDAIKCNLKREHSIIYFRDHESAAKAKKHGGQLKSNMKPIPIFYTTEANVRRKSSSSDTEGLAKKVTKKAPGNEVDEELRAMGEYPLETPKLIKRRAKDKSPSRERVETRQSEPRITDPRITDPKVSEARPSFKKSQLPIATPSAPPPKNKQDTEALLTLLRTVASSSGERYRVLDARDKLMRMKLTKQSDIATAKAVQGTCPDMCPEKERYSRADKFCLSGFEMKQEGQSNIMDPQRVLKEYSRSSADQEEPLSHELRPVKVLQLTMDYLLSNLMDHPDNTMVGEWYDFIWNRTRAIRKDITQQHLCDPVSVTLVEKCARFHIYCSEILSEEDVAVFDPKINNENLTKCLQTLKHFYADLEEKGVICSNEAEFRAFEILLNLNESDIASQVQTLREEIRTSPSVIFANQVFQASSNNNYVRFFALLKRASFLQACIMHRYFAQIRTKALKVILKAYRQPNQFAFDELIRILAFEGPEEAVQFCNWLQLRIVDNFVSLNSGVGTPDGSAPVFRSLNYIESKRSCSVGEIVNGGPLSGNPLNWYIPHDSFDANELLKEEAYKALDQATKIHSSVEGEKSAVPTSVLFPSTETFSPTPKGPLFPPSQNLFAPTSTVAFQPSFTTSSSGITFSPNLIFKGSPKLLAPEATEPIAPVIKTPSPPPTLTEEDIQEITEENVTVIFQDTLNQLSRDIARDTILEFQIHDSATKLLLEATEDILRKVASESVLELKLAKQIEEHEERVDTLAEDINQGLTNNVVDKEITIITTLIHHQLKEEMNLRIATDITEEITLGAIEDNLSEICEEVYNDELDWKLKVKLFLQKKALQRSKKYFLRWKKICAQRKTLDFVRRTFPAAPLFVSDDFCNLRINDDPKTILEVSQETKKANKNIDCRLYINMLNDCMIRQPVDVLNVIGPILLRKFESSKPRFVPVKIVVVPPAGDNDSQLGFAEWVTSKFGFTKPCKIDLDKEIIAESKSYSDSFGRCNIGLSQIVVGNTSKPLTDSRKLLGLSMIILFYDVSADTVESVREKLNFLLKNKPIYPPIPVAVFLINYEAWLHQNLRCELNTMLEDLAQHRVSDFTISGIDFNGDADIFNTRLVDCLRKTTEGILPQPALESLYLRDYLEQGLRKFSLDRIFQDLASKQNQWNSRHIQALDSIVELHNSVIEHLANVATDMDLSNHSFPPPEFLRNLICYSVNWNQPQKLNKLKETIVSLRIDPDCIESLDYLQRDTVFKVISNIFGPCSHAVITEVNDVLERFTMKYIPWAEIYIIILRHLLIGPNYMDDENEVTVHFDRLEFDDFSLPNVWLEATRDTVCEFLSGDESSEELETPVVRVVRSDNNNFNLTNLGLLEEKVVSEKMQSREFGQKLQKMVDDDNYPMGDTTWLPLPPKRILSYSEEFTIKKPKFEISGYVPDDVSNLNTALETEKFANKIFRKRLEQILSDDSF